MNTEPIFPNRPRKTHYGPEVRELTGHEQENNAQVLEALKHYRFEELLDRFLLPQEHTLALLPTIDIEQYVKSRLEKKFSANGIKLHCEEFNPQTYEFLCGAADQGCYFPIKMKLDSVHLETVMQLMKVFLACIKQLKLLTKAGLMEDINYTLAKITPEGLSIQDVEVPVAWVPDVYDDARTFGINGKVSLKLDTDGNIQQLQLQEPVLKQTGQEATGEVTPVYFSTVTNGMNVHAWVTGMLAEKKLINGLEDTGRRFCNDLMDAFRKFPDTRQIDPFTGSRARMDLKNRSVTFQSLRFPLGEKQEHGRYVYDLMPCTVSVQSNQTLLAFIPQQPPQPGFKPLPQPQPGQQLFYWVTQLDQQNWDGSEDPISHGTLR